MNFETPELVVYLQSKGISLVDVLRDGKDWTMSPCPHCGKETTGKAIHFAISPDNVGFCHVCKQSGNLFQYRKMYGDGNPLSISKNPLSVDFRDQKGKLIGQWKANKRKKKLENPTMNLPNNFSDFAEKTLWADHPIAEAARSYLQGRGFSSEVLKSFKIGLAFRGSCQGKEIKNEQGESSCDYFGSAGPKGACPKCGKQIVNKYPWISIPYFTHGESKEATLYKYRSLPPNEKDFQRETGGLTDIFGTWKTDLKFPYCFITEAELDALAVTQLGAKNVFCLAGGVAISQEWLAEFEAFETIYLAGDNDDPGEANIEKWAEALGAFRCRVVRWPEGIKDAAEFLKQGGNKNEWEALVLSSERIVGKVWLRGTDLKEALDKFLRLHGEDRGVPTGFSVLDKIWGGVRYGEWSAITGDTGSGKSIWTSQVALNLAKYAGVPSAVASFELRLADVAMRAVTQCSGRSVYAMRNDTLALGAAIEALSQVPLYFLDLYGEIALTDLKQILAFGVARYGIRFIVLDHLHYFLPGLDERNEKIMIDNACKTFTQWAAEWGVHIFVVVHPRKMNQQHLRPEMRRVDGDMLKGSSGIKQEAFNILSLYRARGYEKLKASEGVENIGAAELTVYKCRSPLGREGSVWFEYFVDSLLYSDLSLTENARMIKEDRKGYKKTDIKASEDEEEESIDEKQKTKKGYVSSVSSIVPGSAEDVPF